MSNEKNTLDDLFDDDISRALKDLGFIFPQTVEDFQKLETEVKQNPISQPDKLKDAFSLLGKTHRKKRVGIVKSLQDINDYSSNFAQAARELKVIPEELFKQMQEDKKKALDGKKKDK